MLKVGYIGLGLMGKSIARNLLKAGHEVALWSHTASKAEEMAKEGKGTACATPADVARQSECVFLCVGDTEMMEEAILGKDGIIHGAKAGSVVVDASTVAPAPAARCRRHLPNPGSTSWMRPVRDRSPALKVAP